MKIKYLTYFQEVLKDWDNLRTQSQFSRPLNLAQIEVIEKTIYQNSLQKLPLVLREMLFLTGGFCPFFCTGIFIYRDEQGSLDEKILLRDRNNTPYFRKVKARNEIDFFFKDRLIWPFFTVYESSDNFLFIYLDEDEDDPIIYSFDTDKYYREGYKEGDNLISDDVGFYYGLKKVKLRLRQLINKEYKNFCCIYNQRPPYNVRIPSLYVESSTPNNDNHTKNQNTFFTLISNRDISGANYFIEKGIDVTFDNNRAIIETAATNDTEIFELLFAAGANPYDQDEKILEVAMRKKNGNMFYYLLDKLQFTQDTINRAIIETVAINDTKKFELLFAVGANPYDQDEKILEVAIRKKNWEMFYYLLDKLQFTQDTINRALVDVCALEEGNGFMEARALKKGKPSQLKEPMIIKKLIEKGANINSLEFQLNLMKKKFVLFSVKLWEWFINN